MFNLLLAFILSTVLCSNHVYAVSNIALELSESDIPKAKEAFLSNKFGEAIDYMNKVDFDSASHTVLVKTFDPQFFQQISTPFVEYCHNENFGKEWLRKPWFQALAMIPLIVERFETFTQDSNESKKGFYELRDMMLFLAKCKKVAHAYGLIENTVYINKEKLSVALSYPGVLAGIMREHGDTFSSNFQVKEEKTRRFVFDKNRFADNRKNASEGLELTAYPVSLSLPFLSTSDGVTFQLVEKVHLISLVIMMTDSNTLIAIGDRGGKTKYRGIQVYRVHNSTMMDNVKMKLRESLYSPMEEDEFAKLLKDLNLNEEYQIPAMEQLRSYCGFQSAGELNEFSLTFFAAMHSIKSRKGTSLSWDDGLETAKMFTYVYHIKQMNDFRSRNREEAIDSLKRHPKLEVGQPFFDDLHLVEGRYGDISPYRPSQITPHSPLPGPYEYYLKQQRYPSQEFSQHQSTQIEEALAKLFSMYKKLSNDFDEDLLFDMSQLDTALKMCHTFGFDKAEGLYRCQELHNQVSKNPFLAWKF